MKAIARLLHELQRVLFGQRHRRVRFGLAWLMYVLILVLGSIPNARKEVGEYASGLVLHSVAYAVITFLLVTGSQRGRAGRSVQAVLIVIVMGAVDECVQSFFPYRHAAVSDWLVDCASAMLTAVTMFLLARRHAAEVGAD